MVEPEAIPLEGTVVESVYRPFLELISSGKPINIPPETFYGAITHFTSTLPALLVQELLTALIASTNAWDDAARTQEAVKYGIITRLREEEKGKNKWFKGWRAGNEKDKWLETVAGPMMGGGNMGENRSRILVAILIGAGEAQYESRMRSKLEEEVVLLIARGMEGKPGMSKGTLRMLCEVCEYVQEERLRALNLQSISETLRDELFQSLSTPEQNSTGVPISILSRTYSLILHTLLGGTARDRTSVWTSVEDLCARISNIQEKGSKSRSPSGSESQGNEFALSKSRLFSFLTIASAFLPELLLAANSVLSIPHLDGGLDPSPLTPYELSVGILHTLATFADIISEVEGGTSSYHRLLYGCLDIVASDQSGQSLRKLSKPIARDSSNLSPAEGAWWLHVSENLVHQLDGRAVREIVMPLIIRFIHDSENRDAFEASHAMLLALITSASEALERDSNQPVFLEETVRFYTRLLLKQGQRGDISTDQLRAAYPIAIGAAARHSTNLLVDCLQLLVHATPTAIGPEQGEWQQTLLLTRISCAPHLPLSQLMGYLDNVGADIINLENPGYRLPANASLFKVIMEDLPDSHKRQGMLWWANGKIACMDLH